MLLSARGEERFSSIPTIHTYPVFFSFLSCSKANIVGKNFLLDEVVLPKPLLRFLIKLTNIFLHVSCIDGFQQIS